MAGLNKSSACETYYADQLLDYVMHCLQRDSPLRCKCVCVCVCGCVSFFGFNHHFQACLVLTFLSHIMTSLL